MCVCVCVCVCVWIARRGAGVCVRTEEGARRERKTTGEPRKRRVNTRCRYALGHY